ncbi:GntR family transcriptional regulator [Rhodovibrio salinarum]|uniref:GntR family transcriptional regulator n=1 Tax=Rhodovibrio salinarum TaxID=1087 RepID=A0A934QMY1_9PROT|nr:GntR family transcriptional regulator [Rhodovibrio salinarum]MBK1699174.1 GntR family transcriptional regulator [Rhodovibrio salinarum]
MSDKASDGSDDSLAGDPVPESARARPSRDTDPALPARERAYRDMRYRILEGGLAPGTTLLETELAALLSMSRTPIREAAIRLEKEGLVTIRPRHGITVRALSLDDLAEIYEVFSALEVRAAGLAALRGLAPETVTRMRGLLDAMEQATRRDQIEYWSRLDDAFHSAIAAASGNPRLQSTLRLYWDQQYRARLAIVPLRSRPTRSDAEHRAIFEAICAGDEAEAERLMRGHRERADAQTLELLRSRPSEAHGGTA